MPCFELQRLLQTCAPELLREVAVWGVAAVAPPPLRCTRNINANNLISSSRGATRHVKLKQKKKKVLAKREPIQLKSEDDDAGKGELPPCSTQTGAGQNQGKACRIPQ